ncbi:MAG TPA: DJ-1/PfpI family protein [Gammaproteobacteria bacterium]|nr:DJ-1/PfpI family protein [Gammaproteobacteria bacterium]
MEKLMRLGALFYSDFELLDAYGPLEMFGCLGEDLEIVSIAEQAGPVRSTPGVAAYADFSFADAPELDLILVPGGVGTLAELENTALLDFLKDRCPKSQITMSVCTGSALLAQADLLNGRKATTNKMYFEMARGVGAAVDWQEAARCVDAGQYVTSSGVSAGTDMALAIIARLFGKARAEKITRFTEYQWHQDADNDPFLAYLNKPEAL